MSDVTPPDPAFRFVVLLDFEATCDDVEPPRPQEIIEFPSVLLRIEDRVVVDVFESFVRPVHHPTLTPFCTGLTSITQDDVDPAPTFPEVLDAWTRWAAGHGLTADNTLVATCGDWDLRTMLPVQQKAAGVDRVPSILRRWLNVKVPFKAMFPGIPANLPSMLETLGRPLLGRHHRGIDDCRNLSTILVDLLDRGAPVGPTASRA